MKATEPVARRQAGPVEAELLRDLIEKLRLVSTRMMVVTHRRD